MESLLVTGAYCIFIIAFILGGIVGTLWMNSCFDKSYYGVRKLDFPQEIQDKLASDEYILSIVALKNPKHNTKPNLS